MATSTNIAKNAGYNTNVSSHESIHSKARINWFILGSWSVMLVMCFSFWAGVIALFMWHHHGAMCASRHLVYFLYRNRRIAW